MTARAFRCHECGYPFRTAEQGWARDASLMCPACGSIDVEILAAGPRWDGVTMTAAEAAHVTAGGVDAAAHDAATVAEAREAAAEAGEAAAEAAPQRPTLTDGPAAR